MLQSFHPPLNALFILLKQFQSFKPLQHPREVQGQSKFQGKLLISILAPVKRKKKNKQTKFSSPEI